MTVRYCVRFASVSPVHVCIYVDFSTRAAPSIGAFKINSPFLNVALTLSKSIVLRQVNRSE
jgi:hypothetical protein